MLRKRLFVRERSGFLTIGITSPGGTPSASTHPFPFISPLSPSDAEALRWYLEESLAAPFGAYAERRLSVERRLSSWGTSLFGCLFPAGNDARRAYNQVAVDDDWELWLESTSNSFLSLPWELLREEDQSPPLATRVPISRCIASPSPDSVIDIVGELRVLLVIARPGGIEDVAYRIVGRRVLQMLQASGRPIHVQVLRPPTVLELRRQLAAAAGAGRPFHILHFDGHGVVGAHSTRGPSEQEGYLLFEGTASGPDRVAATDLVSMLRRFRVPLIVLNACRGGQIGAELGIETGVATSLLQAGATSVVAMGYVVYAEAAAEFANGFYQQLVQGATTASAVLEGRRQLHTTPLRNTWTGALGLQDWMVPVQYASGNLRLAVPDYRTNPTTHDPVPDTTSVPTPVFGRDAEILQCERELRAHRVVHVYGPVGIGKSALLSELFAWLSATGWEGGGGRIFGVEFDTDTARKSIDEIFIELGIQAYGHAFTRDYSTCDDRHTAILDMLRTQGAVVVFDHVEYLECADWTSGAGSGPVGSLRDSLLAFLRQADRQHRGSVFVVSNGYLKWLSEFGGLHLYGLGPDGATQLAEHTLSRARQATRPDEDSALQELLERLAAHPQSLQLVLPHLAHKSASEILKAVGSERSPQDIGSPLDGAFADWRMTLHDAFEQLPLETQQAAVFLTFYEDLVDTLSVSQFRTRSPSPERFRALRTEDWIHVIRCSTVGLLQPTSLMGVVALHPAAPSFLHERWREQAGDRFPLEYEQARSAHIDAVRDLALVFQQQLREGHAQHFTKRTELNKAALERGVREALAVGRYDDANVILRPLCDYMIQREDLEGARKWVRYIRQATEQPAGTAPSTITAAGALWLLALTINARIEISWENSSSAEALHAEVLAAMRRDEPVPPGFTEQHAHRLSVIDFDRSGIALQRGDFDQAEKLARAAIATSEAIGWAHGVAAGYNQLGQILAKQGRPVESRECQERAYEIQERLGNTRAINLSTIAFAELADGSGLDEALRVAESLGDLSQQQTIHRRLGGLAARQEDFIEAERHFQAASRLALQTGNLSAVAKNYELLGLLCLRMKKLAEAMTWLEKSVAMSRDGGQHRSLVAGLGLLVHLNCACRQWEVALGLTCECLAVAASARIELPQSVLPDLIGATYAAGLPTLERIWTEQTGQELPLWMRDHIRRQILGPELPLPIRWNTGTRRELRTLPRL
jgi:tetratricopeptide (TPR) repeat protein